VIERGNRSQTVASAYGRRRRIRVSVLALRHEVHRAARGVAQTTGSPAAIASLTTSPKVSRESTGGRALGRGVPRGPARPDSRSRVILVASPIPAASRARDGRALLPVADGTRLSRRPRVRASSRGASTRSNGRLRAIALAETSEYRHSCRSRRVDVARVLCASDSRRFRQREPVVVTPYGAPEEISLKAPRTHD
jgi:hypothetical protein